MSKKGKLSNCLAVCDVSGSMSGTPMEVCVALGLLVSELSEEPWKGKVITFSEKPELHLVQGETLQEKTEFIRRMEWPRSWETDYQAIQRKFGEKGYSRVPEIVFWNLRDSSATPVVGTQNGVALVSGFSKNLLTMFMDGGGIVNPEDVMGLAIAGEEYKKLVVFD
ncbi:unnamed protein product [Linum tenue]|uniref:DUF7788 domain-containing protein n=1 Tax=Linum tenue TaxID=586396 RepID=A0AAV0NHE0_9ROSI|nr:unnamed protein product [Linum tenue]